MKKAFAKFIFHTIFGWKITGSFHQEVKKYVLIGAPHTSWKDFFVGILSRNAAGAKVNLIAKDSLFWFPLSIFLRVMKVSPVDRSKSTNLVDAIVAVFNSKEEFRLAISPEGTRKPVAKWKTGFYHIANGANVPIVMFGFDFGNKQALISEPYYLTGDMDTDFKHFHNFYKDIKGDNPELFNKENFM